MRMYAVVFLYLVAIVSANVVTASTVPFQFGEFIIPAGTFIIGATFILRDLVQNYLGRKKTYLLIGVAIVMSAITSSLLGDTLWIVFASVLTFLFSETTDTEIYTRLKLPLAWRVAYSGIVGGFLDSVIFVIVGLSPLGANFLPWDAVVYAILGQIIVKTIIQLFGAAVFGLVGKRFINHSLQ
ncbi:VUT family protein [Paenibacillus sp. PR3]|uniref:VUT family protein n=1 Tax=Paenibacillus terricola TaxID=2763503 RepID=A0ABR8MZJ8_9BACL|nr:VUT family protein [Paenibacillus terricola]MBD3921010.1 VUT family protein [Paenibacillus terricola]